MTETGQQEKAPGFFEKRPWVAIAILGVYIALLALGTVGEVFKIQWILDIPIFKGP
ncbi:MAG TPA: hypothetical protein VGK71_08730 [Nitrospirota bacterium]|jgi:hypothetical protein